MDTIKDIWSSLWNNKPLFITILVALGVLIYFFYKSVIAPNNAQQSPQVLTDGTVATGGEPVVTPIQKTIQYVMNITNPTPTSQSTGNPPPAQVPAAVSSTPVVARPSGTPQPATARTVTVTPWPSQFSTLWGIAQKEYNDGNQWPKIYAANKDKIKDPNLIYAGQVLNIP